MRNHSDDTGEKKYYNDDNYNYSPVESCVPLIHSGEEVALTMSRDQRDYPGNRRVPIIMSSPPSGTVLVRTAGNALQSIPATILEAKQQQQSSQLIEVQVPPNARPGDVLHVRSPYTNTTSCEEEIIAATIPDGVYPGQTFYVQCPNRVDLTTVAVVAIKEDEEAQLAWC